MMIIFDFWAFFLAFGTSAFGVFLYENFLGIDTALFKFWKLLLGALFLASKILITLRNLAALKFRDFLIIFDDLILF